VAVELRRVGPVLWKKLLYLLTPLVHQSDSVVDIPRCHHIASLQDGLAGSVKTYHFYLGVATSLQAPSGLLPGEASPDDAKLDP
jgi:hypothetical protein